MIKIHIADFRKIIDSYGRVKGCGGKSNKNVKTVTKPLAKKVVQKYITIEVKVTVYWVEIFFYLQFLVHFLPLKLWWCKTPTFCKATRSSSAWTKGRPTKKTSTICPTTASSRTFCNFPNCGPPIEPWFAARDRRRCCLDCLLVRTLKKLQNLKIRPNHFFHISPSLLKYLHSLFNATQSLMNTPKRIQPTVTFASHFRAWCNAIRKIYIFQLIMWAAMTLTCKTRKKQFLVFFK